MYRIFPILTKSFNDSRISLISFEVKFINSVRDVYKFEGICYKGDVKVSEAEFSAMITYK